MKTHTSRRGITAAFTVDFRGNVLSQTLPGYTASYTYDANGNLTQASDTNPGGVPLFTSKVIYGYDHLDRLVSASSGGSGSPSLPGVTLSYSRDAEGFVTSVSGGPQGQVDFTNNGVGLPSGIATQAGDFGLGYDKRLLPVRLAYPTGAAAVMSYDAGGNLLEAKGPGYNQFLEKGKFQWIEKGFLTQAKRQTIAAGSTPIEWHFAEEAAANATRKLFDNKGIKGIKVIYNP